jgi:hypothetical protein
MTPAEVLRRAADLIEEHGWVKGKDAWAIWRATGACCAGIAIGLVVDSQPVGEKSDRWSVAREVERRVPENNIVCWNDAQPNGDVVIAKLREVADDLERAS